MLHINIYFAEDVNFSQDKTDQNVEGGTSVRLEGLNEDDIENRLNLGGLEGFAGQVSFVP